MFRIALGVQLHFFCSKFEGIRHSSLSFSFGSVNYLRLFWSSHCVLLILLSYVEMYEHFIHLSALRTCVKALDLGRSNERELELQT